MRGSDVADCPNTSSAVYGRRKGRFYAERLVHARAADETPRRLHDFPQQREVEREMRHLARQEAGVRRHVHLRGLEHALVRHQERTAALTPAARQPQQPQRHHRQHVHRAHAALRARP